MLLDGLCQEKKFILREVRVEGYESTVPTLDEVNVRNCQGLFFVSSP